MLLLAALACTSETPTHQSPPSFLSAARAVIPEAFTGTVTEVLDVPGYTYVRVASAGTEHWVVALSREVEVGDAIDVRPMGALSPFESKALDRTFDRVVFAIFTRSST